MGDVMQNHPAATAARKSRTLRAQAAAGARIAQLLLGFACAFLFWYLTVDVWQLPRFANLPGPSEVFSEWFSPDPIYGLSFYTPDYYWHILHSLARVGVAFVLATLLGVPLGLLMGWSQRVREYVFPLFELLRPIPPLAWVPLAILMFHGTETPVIFLTFLAAFFATALNSMLGARSIDPSLIRAARCLGAGEWRLFSRIVVPGALPQVFSGLQISLGVAWFSLVAAEMVSGEYGLGYLINTGYSMATYPTIFIGMITLGVVGYLTSVVIRLIEHALLRWGNDEQGGRS
ncbi:ABC transporter permease [Stutzerimonas azotifigens]|uniref:ABC transporter permease n=1 Tax=Stutzerimonas azotifigens TaxID=291995 RepID=UPI000A065538|nr:ABC transporter permease [Stutzerimonas azotifigens]